jgi:hypothetical protein
MPTRFDKKGKYYTEKVTKDRIKVTVRTVTDTLSGYFHIPPDKRLRDSLNNTKPFLALTDGAVLSEEGEVIREFDFMALHQHHIVWVIELEERQPIPTPGGSI